MQFHEAAIAGAYVVRPEPRNDERGSFARLWCEEEFAKQGLMSRFVQVNTAFSPKARTLRGMHFQTSPHAEVKIVRCTRGRVFDVLVDLRRQSPSYRRWFGIVLTPTCGSMLYVPKGCAHGYLTLNADSEVMYFTSHVYLAESARGVRYDDEAFGINWPEPAEVISMADRSWAPFSDAMATCIEDVDA